MSRSCLLYVIPPVGGTPAAVALPSLCQHGDVHALVFGTPPGQVDPLLRAHCASVTCLSLDSPMPETITAAASRVGADAILTLSETAIVAVAEACEELGLRGPGPGVLRSRDKVLMRQCWQEASLPIPAFAPVRSYEDLVQAARQLRRPFLLKPSWLAGSLAQVLVGDDTDIEAAWRSATEAIGRVEAAGVRDFLPKGRGPQFIAEEIIQATTQSWYEVAGYGDYVSVEGLVVGGRYHPLCITARMPTLPPFIEVGFHSPTVLSVENQRRIEDTARAAVDALGLDYCGTHTEIKLQADQGLCLIESAARLGGAMIARLVREAFDLDLIGLLAGVLVGNHQAPLPERMLTSGSTGRTAASLMMMAADSSGRPWELAEPVAYRPDLVDWGRLTSPQTEVEIVGGRPLGSPMPAFTTTGGTLNFAGTLLLQGPDPAVLLADCYRVLDGLEEALRSVARSVAPVGVS